MTGFEVHPEARLDLDEIRDHIAQANPDAADRLVRELFDAFRAIVQFPNQGYLRPDLTTSTLRFKLVRDFMIVYDPEKRPLLIAAVFHGRRSPRVMAAILRGREH